MAHRPLDAEAELVYPRVLDVRIDPGYGLAQAVDLVAVLDRAE
jgi:hypothetical protein